MKKSNILIAVFAVAMAAASAAKAGEIVDFDGKSRTPSMPAIFVVGQSYAQVSDLAQAAVPTASATVPVLGGNNVDQAVFKVLAAYYAAQPRIKTLVSGYYLGKGDAAGAANLAGKSVRVLASADSVVVINDGRLERIDDSALAVKVADLALPSIQRKGVVDLIVAGAAIIDAATNNATWNAVGDAVSNATEALTSHNYNDPNAHTEHACGEWGGC